MTDFTSYTKAAAQVRAESDYQKYLQQQAMKAAGQGETKDKPMDCVQGMAGKAMYSESSIRERLEKKHYQHRESDEKVTRALDLMSRHPEFEDYVELDRLLQSIGI